MSRPLTYVHSRTAVLRDENIDTDRIIPARFLTTTERTGLGKHCFEDWRYAADGSDDPAFPLNQPQARGCSILVAGRNFGCGSSREHAPWALLDYGMTFLAFDVRKKAHAARIVFMRRVVKSLCSGQARLVHAASSPKKPCRQWVGRRNAAAPQSVRGRSVKTGVKPANSTCLKGLLQY